MSMARFMIYICCYLQTRKLEEGESPRYSLSSLFLLLLFNLSPGDFVTLLFVIMSREEVVSRSSSRVVVLMAMLGLFVGVGLNSCCCMSSIGLYLVG